MTTDSNIPSDKEDQPLTRSDIAKLQAAIGNSYKIDLANRNLSHIDLTEFFLQRAILTRADLTSADLTRALQLHFLS